LKTRCSIQAHHLPLLEVLMIDPIELYVPFFKDIGSADFYDVVVFLFKFVQVIQNQPVQLSDYYYFNTMFYSVICNIIKCFSQERRELREKQERVVLPQTR
jgi:hypothetical protein